MNRNVLRIDPKIERKHKNCHLDVVFQPNRTHYAKLICANKRCRAKSSFIKWLSKAEAPLVYAIIDQEKRNR